MKSLNTSNNIETNCENSVTKTIRLPRMCLDTSFIEDFGPNVLGLVGQPCSGKTTLIKTDLLPMIDPTHLLVIESIAEAAMAQHYFPLMKSNTFKDVEAVALSSNVISVYGLARLKALAEKKNADEFNVCLVLEHYQDLSSVTKLCQEALKTKYPFPLTIIYTVGSLRGVSNELLGLTKYLMISRHFMFSKPNTELARIDNALTNKGSLTLENNGASAHAFVFFAQTDLCKCHCNFPPPTVQSSISAKNKNDDEQETNLVVCQTLPKPPKQQEEQDSEWLSLHHSSESVELTVRIKKSQLLKMLAKEVDSTPTKQDGSSSVNYVQLKETERKVLLHRILMHQHK